mmetsp:Transcript_39334/g.65634  ORF Transcript_39334/g.65634 Transcript_39334/m.65634 type:complete len:235 (+) Transcript_39334:209-913(+)
MEIGSDDVVRLVLGHGLPDTIASDDDELVAIRNELVLGHKGLSSDELSNLDVPVINGRLEAQITKRSGHGEDAPDASSEDKTSLAHDAGLLLGVSGLVETRKRDALKAIPTLSLSADDDLSVSSVGRVELVADDHTDSCRASILHPLLLGGLAEAVVDLDKGRAEGLFEVASQEGVGCDEAVVQLLGEVLGSLGSVVAVVDPVESTGPREALDDVLEIIHGLESVKVHVGVLHL